MLISLGCHNKELQMGGIEQQTLFSHRSGDQKSEIKVLAGLVPSEAEALFQDVSLAVDDHPFPVSFYIFFPL